MGQEVIFLKGIVGDILKNAFFHKKIIIYISNVLKYN